MRVFTVSLMTKKRFSYKIEVSNAVQMFVQTFGAENRCHFDTFELNFAASLIKMKIDRINISTFQQGANNK